jgi:hypothetical protein
VLAHSALVTQVEFFDVQILKLAKSDQKAAAALQWL